MKAPHPSQPTIFVIDDDAMIRRILMTALNQYNLMSFSEGQLAVKHLKDNPGIKIDLAISDFGMPNSDGVETLKAIHQIVPTAKLMLISGTISDELQRACSNNQFDQYLTKPFSISELQESVKRLVSHVIPNKAEALKDHQSDLKTLAA
jgi:response regulator RpfG family c-di-GMP phosphodiesterase